MSGGLIAGSRPIQVDIAIVADIRVGDVAAPCHAAAAAALRDAGYSVAVVPVISGAIATDPYEVDRHMADLLNIGAVRRVGPGASINCGLALAFDSRIFAGTLACMPRIEAKQRIVTVERPAALTALDRPTLDRLREKAEIAMGGPIVWSPTSITARDAMACSVPDWPVTNENWAPVAPDYSHVRADAEERARPTIGRARIARARPNGAWPSPFLLSPLVSLRERGKPLDDTAIWPHAAPRENWPESTVNLAEFFAKIDLLANPDDAEIDPFPAEALMALSAGVVPCLPESYRELFGGAAVYGSDTDLVQAAINLKLEPGLMSAARQSGVALLREVFSRDTFVARVKEHVEPSRGVSFAPVVHAEPRARVLFYSTNGIGMGHLTRQLAIARRLPERFQPVFVSHSRAVDTVRQFGFVGEHLPYHTTYGEAQAHWNVGLAAALSTAFAFYKPQVTVFDGNVPFKGLLNALAGRPGMASVWVRRAMWGAGRDAEALDRAAAFDLVVEPLDPAWPNDEGPTVALQSDVRVVPSVRILDQNETPSRQDACAALGLDPLKTNVLVATGSGNNFDIAGITHRVIGRLDGRFDLGLAVAEWQIAKDRLDLPDTISRLTGYPFAQYLSAFDFAVAAPGYNTFCEHMAAGLPTLWVPNENEQMDRQIDRARYAVDRRCGLMVRRDAPFDVTPALDQLLDQETRDVMAQNGLSFAKRNMTENGASVIAETIGHLASSSIARLPIGPVAATETEKVEEPVL
ncbi:antifreeze protein [Tateyamaria sp. Alg231-49]|uniref:antifreeze protein n=1 Tax=Tateyamaria sp. Alg231-49 TaxID=1922219 RepID=UPI000D55F65C|nr:antifreeze protein [Tateyamaria sp. Alg231-49]